MLLTINDLLQNHPSLETCRNTIESARDLLIDTYHGGGKLLLCGNGGSCADCDHIAGELLKGFLSHRPLSEEDCMALADTLPDGEADPDLYLLAGQLQGGLPAISLPAQTAVMTAVSSMRLLVVSRSPPDSSFWWGPYIRMAPHPPGPGLPEQAPSVYRVTVFKAVPPRPGPQRDGRTRYRR